MDVECPNNVILENEVSGNGEGGLHFERVIEIEEDENGNPVEVLVNSGDDNTVSENEAEDNAGDGFQVEGATGNVFTDNESSGNGGYGFADDTGADAASVQNSYEDNECKGNAAGPSNPAGLCD